MSHEYPKPALTVDMVVIRFFNGRLEVLLIERKHPPFEGGWALPGGFVDQGESPAEAAARELLEETKVEGLPYFEIGTFGTPDRDPRGWVVSNAFVALAPESCSAEAGDDAAQAIWHRMEALPKLAFDHGEIIERAREYLRERTQLDTTPLLLLPRKFRTAQARHLYAQLWQDKIPPRPFKAWLRRREAVQWVGPGRFERSDALHPEWIR